MGNEREKYYLFAQFKENSTFAAEMGLREGCMPSFSTPSGKPLQPNIEVVKSFLISV